MPHGVQGEGKTILDRSKEQIKQGLVGLWEDYARNRQAKSELTVKTRAAPGPPRAGAGCGSIHPAPPSAIILHSIVDGVGTVDLNSRSPCSTGPPKRSPALRRWRPWSGRAARSSGPLSVKPLRLEPDDGNGQTGGLQPIAILRADGKEIPITMSTVLLRMRRGGSWAASRPSGTRAPVERPAPGGPHGRTVGRHPHQDCPECSGSSPLSPDIAESDSTVPIEGESGNGKELVARALHHLEPPVAPGPWLRSIAVRCPKPCWNRSSSAISPAPLPTPSAAAGALPWRTAAPFLDEIGDISPALQVRLLRVLEERAYTPWGPPGPSRPTCASSPPPTRTWSNWWQRASFARTFTTAINVVKLTLPPLAERKEDIPLLASISSSVSTSCRTRNPGTELRHPGHFHAARLARQYPELENAIEYAFIICPQGSNPAPASARPPQQETITGSLPPQPELKEQEKRLLWEALERHGWRRLATAGNGHQ